MNKKKLFVTVIRHAKSSWNDQYITDHDRPLNQRGQKNAPDMGIRLKQSNFIPDQVYTSTALRASSTAEIICQKINFPSQKIIKNTELYLAPVSQWQKIIEQLENNIKSVLFVGHNPGITNLVNRLWGLPLDNVPTCGIIQAVFEEIDWKVAASSIPKTAYYDFPKNKKGQALKIV